MQTSGRRRRRRGRSRRLLGLQLIAAIAFFSAGVIFVTLHHSSRIGDSRPKSGFAAAPNAPKSRPVYPYSVVPGGIADEREFAAVRASDPLLAMHYRDIGPAARRQAVASDRMLYASYRVGGLIYWTKQPVLVHRGETVLTDGSNWVRSRCGNRLSSTPREPTRFVEPPSVSGDAPVSGEVMADAPDIAPQNASGPEIAVNLADAPGKSADPARRGDNAGKMIFSPVPTVFWPETPPRAPLVVPEASTWMTMLGGLGLVAILARRRR